MAAVKRLVGQSIGLRRLPPVLFTCCRDITTKLFVGGLSFYTTEDGLSEAFSQCGHVTEAKIVMDRVSGKSKGFGFVSFASEDEAQKAITEMDGKALNGRVIFVDIAKPKTSGGGGMPIARGPPE
ncbi:glycine-rich RNA-binding protein 4 mitochondrial isoform X1 [Tripterygium wilfordii]|uniref:Glycine-rich RNA-binding protein 4 mitochondrial isoform X1 n=1 Tax=Tripterygium wilfordii TaxID=458696 RepID=A0A7J7CTJ2_TRIWF|nr:small RNA-binding protein 11, chloroplastic-like isoform X2 [Tripterygium wilfordii]KAF5737432.1 glycine-rich RNA-binding protein 4 mitochondrial isoform X1 [Tripterygium wilfordii]